MTKKKKIKRPILFFSSPTSIFPPYVCVSVHVLPRARARPCVCVCASSQYNERILYFNKKARLDGTLNQLQFTTNDGRVGISSRSVPRAATLSLIANRTLVCFICLYTKPNHIIITYMRVLSAIYCRRRRRYYSATAIYSGRGVLSGY